MRALLCSFGWQSEHGRQRGSLRRRGVGWTYFLSLFVACVFVCFGGWRGLL